MVARCRPLPNPPRSVQSLQYDPPYCRTSPNHAVGNTGHAPTHVVVMHCIVVTCRSYSGYLFHRLVFGFGYCTYVSTLPYDCVPTSAVKLSTPVRVQRAVRSNASVTHIAWQPLNRHRLTRGIVFTPQNRSGCYHSVFFDVINISSMMTGVCPVVVRYVSN